MADKGSRKTTQSPGTTREPRTRNVPTYQNRTHKFATLFVMTTGSANATQFPSMFIYYGGVPFLLAYLTFLGCVAFPVLRLESNLVQFVGDGNRGIFSTVPLFIGLGYSMTVYALVHAVADTVQLSDALSLLLSWTKSFDWHHDCPGGWMTRNFSCQAVRRGSIPCKLARDRIAEIFRRVARTEGVPLAGKDGVKLVPISSYEQFVNDGCIPDLENTGPPYDFRRQPIWEPTSYDVTRAGPAFAIAAIWLVVFAIAHRGFLKLKTCFYAFVLLHVASTLMLLVRASTLAGAARGLRVLMLSNWSSVTNLEMWSHALYASLESVGVTGTIYIGIERLSCFKNRFQHDVMFVLVADTASKGIGTVVSFLFLGHMSYTTGVSVHMLVDADFNFIVSITPQAVSLVPHPEFWSRVHSLWVVSMMLPKFLIVPDIVMEVLSASCPRILVHRRQTHFVICGFLFLTSIVASFPGGAKLVSVVSQSQWDLRLLLLALEVIVILQFYGVRRLGIDSWIMTNEYPGSIVNLCWTAVTPVTIIVLLSVKLIQHPMRERRYPPFVEAAIMWLEAVEVSFIPVHAIVFMLRTKLTLRDCLDPLPTWTPVNWEHSMLYRQHLAAEGLDAHRLEKEEAGAKFDQVVPATSTVCARSPSKSLSSSSSGQLGTHLILTSEAKVSPSTSDWRYDSSDEANAKPPVKWRSAPDKLVQRSGTYHKSLSLSAVWRLVRSKPSSTEQGKEKAPICAPSSMQVAPGILATLPLVPRSDAGPTAPAVSPEGAAVVAEAAALEDSYMIEEVPVDSHRLQKGMDVVGIPRPSQTPVVLPSGGPSSGAAAPASATAHGSVPGQRLAIIEERLRSPLNEELAAPSVTGPKKAPEREKADLPAKHRHPASGPGRSAAKGQHGQAKRANPESQHRRLAPRKASVVPTTEDLQSSCGAGALSPTSPLLPTSANGPTSPGDIVSSPEPALPPPQQKRRPESSPKRSGGKVATAVASQDRKLTSPTEEVPGKKASSQGPPHVPSKAHEAQKTAKSRTTTAGSNAPSGAIGHFHKTSKAPNRTTAAPDRKSASGRAPTAAGTREKKASPWTPARKMHLAKRKTHGKSGVATPNEKAPSRRTLSAKSTVMNTSEQRRSTAVPTAAQGLSKAAVPAVASASSPSKAKGSRRRGSRSTQKARKTHDHKSESPKAPEGTGITSPAKGGEYMEKRLPTLSLGDPISAVVSEMEDLNQAGDKLVLELSLLDSKSPAQQPERTAEECPGTSDVTSKFAVVLGSAEWEAEAKEDTNLPSTAVRATTTTEPREASAANALDSGSHTDAPSLPTSATLVDDQNGVVTAGRSEYQIELLEELVATSMLEAFADATTFLALDSCFETHSSAKAPVAHDRNNDVISQAANMATDAANVDNVSVTVDIPDESDSARASSLDKNSTAPLSPAPLNGVDSDTTGKTKDDEKKEAKAVQPPKTANGNEELVFQDAVALDSCADASRTLVPLADEMMWSSAVSVVGDEAKKQVGVSQVPSVPQPEATTTTDVPALDRQASLLPPSTSVVVGVDAAGDEAKEGAEAQVEVASRVHDGTAGPSLARPSEDGSQT